MNYSQATAGVSIIICTLNREVELTRLIKDIERQTLLPTEVIIVNGGRPLNKINSTKFVLKILTSQPGLTRQRNLGLKHVDRKSLYICFLDDDTLIVNNDFLASAQYFMEHNRSFVAISSVIMLQKIYKILPYIFSKIFFIRGRILWNGINIPNKMIISSKFNDRINRSVRIYKTGWIPGCVMFIRRSAMRQIEFDESRLGYGEGEDVDISLKLRTLGDLAILNNLIVFHELSTKNRHNSLQKFRSRYESRLKLANDHTKFVNSKLVYLEISILYLYHQMKFFFHKKHELNQRLLFLKKLRNE